MERVEEVPVEGAPAEGALAEAEPHEIPEAPSTDVSTSEEMGSKEPQVPISLGAEGGWVPSDTGGARGLGIPVPGRAEPKRILRRAAPSRSLETAMQGEWLLNLFLQKGPCKCQKVLLRCDKVGPWHGMADRK